MSKTDDYGSWYFNSRRKDLQKIVAELDRLNKLPLGRQTIQTRLKINQILHKLAFFVEVDNDILELLARQDSESRKVLIDLTTLVSSLVSELQKVNGLEERLKNVIDRLSSVEETASMYLDTYESLNQVINKIKKREKGKKQKPKKEKPVYVA